MDYVSAAKMVLGAMATGDLNTLSTYMNNREITQALASRNTAMLHLAVINGFAGAARYLVNHGADLLAMDKDGDIPLTFAAAADDIDGVRIELIDLLVGAGSPVDHRNHNGQTPIMPAAKMGYENAAQRLLELGANARACDNQGRSVMTYAANPSRSYCPSISLVRALVEGGADIDDLYDSDRCLAIDMDPIPRSSRPERYLYRPGVTVMYVSPSTNLYPEVF